MWAFRMTRILGLTVVHHMHIFFMDYCSCPSITQLYLNCYNSKTSNCIATILNFCYLYCCLCFSLNTSSFISENYFDWKTDILWAGKLTFSTCFVLWELNIAVVCPRISSLIKISHGVSSVAV